MLRRFLSRNLLITILLIAPVFANNVSLITPRQMSQEINNKNTILIDVRTPREYKEGHLHKSILLNAHDPLFKEKISKLDKTKKYLIYCHSGGRSHFVSDYMLKNGFLKVSDMKGGITAWKNNGLKIEK